MTNTFGISIEIPEGTAHPRELAGKLALALGEVLLATSTEEVAGDVHEPVSAPKGGAEARNGYAGEEGEARLAQLVREIAPNTRLALRHIADASQTSGKIHAVDLREKLNLGSPSALAGVLTSLGFAERRTGLPKPYAQVWVQDNGSWGNEYAMTPEVAEAVLRLVSEDGSVHAP